MAIGLYRKMVPSDWYIQSPDEKTRLNFHNADDAAEAKAFMEVVYEAGKRTGVREASNQLPEFIATLQEHIEQCDGILARIKGC